MERKKYKNHQNYRDSNYYQGNEYDNYREKRFKKDKDSSHYPHIQYVPKHQPEVAKSSVKEEDKTNNSNNSNNANNSNNIKNVNTLKKLPIMNSKEKIMDYINSSQVLILSGETGCGKSSQVPQFIYEYFQSQNKSCKIICTQPRRLAAINLAKRVAFEMDTKLGDKVGFQVGLNPNYNHFTSIIYVTTGIFLQRLVHEKTLDNYTHIILDEIHERDVNIDFAMVAIKHVLKVNKQIKLILMSATFNNVLFSQYFSYESIANVGSENIISKTRKSKAQEKWNSVSEDNLWGNSESKMKPKSNKKEYWNNSIEEDKQYQYNQAKMNSSSNATSFVINERMYQVKEYYLEEILKYFKDSEKYKEEFERLGNIINQFDFVNPKLYEEAIFGVSSFIYNKIHMENCLNEENSKKTILVFAPGYAEIFDIINCITELAGDKVNEFGFFPLHSSISDEDQSKIFDDLGPNKRKIIVSTNIAESSITIPDLEIVIDFCLEKQSSINSTTHTERLELSWASKASTIQRSGRAGRVKNGIVFRIIPSGFYSELEMYSIPEIVRCSLEKLVLQIKLWNFKEPIEILKSCIEPPSIDDIDNSIIRLRDSGAITCPLPNHPTGEITPLGRMFCDMPCDIKISKLFIFGIIFGCPHKAIIMGSAMQQDKCLIGRYHKEDTAIAILKKYEFAQGSNSDPVMYLIIYLKWIKQFHSNEHQKDYLYLTYEEKRWWKENKITCTVLKEMHLYIQDIYRRLLGFGFKHELLYFDVNDPLSNLKDRIIFSLAAAFYPCYMKARFKYGDIIEKKKNYDKSGDTSNLLIIHNQELDKDRIREEFSKFGEVNVETRFDSKFAVKYLGLNSTIPISSALKMKNIEKKALIKDKEEGNHFGIKIISDYEIMLEDSLTRSLIEIDQDSINYGAVEFNKEILNISYIGYGYSERNDKTYVRHVTKIENYKMLTQFLILFFSPRVEMEVDSNRHKYSGIIVKNVNSKNMINFTYSFTNSDLFEVNKIRGKIGSIILHILNEEKCHPELVKEIINIINKKRIQINNDEGRWNSFEVEIESSYYQQWIPSSDFMIDNDIKQNKQEGFEILQEIKKENITEDSRLWSEEGIEEILQKRKNNLQTRKNYITSLETILRGGLMKETYICCEKCDSFISSLRNIEQITINEDGNIHYLYKLKSKFGLEALQSLTEDQQKSEFVKKYINKKNFSFSSCYHGHVLMLSQNNEFYLDMYSPVKIILPEFIKRNWDLIYFQTNFKDIIFEEQKLLDPFMKGQKLYECKICEEQFVGINKFEKHMKSRSHKEYVEEFLNVTL